MKGLTEARDEIQPNLGLPSPSYHIAQYMPLGCWAAVGQLTNAPAEQVAVDRRPLCPALAFAANRPEILRSPMHACPLLHHLSLSCNPTAHFTVAAAAFACAPCNCEISNSPKRDVSNAWRAAARNASARARRHMWPRPMHALPQVM